MTGSAAYAEWIAVDLRRTRLRAWAMTASGLRAEATSEEGTAGLAPDAVEPALLRLIEPWLGTGVTDIVACGLVGATEGHASAIAVPARPLAGPLVAAPTRDRRLGLRLVPGLSQAEPPDLTCGDETRLAGWLARRPGWDGVVCLPGSHTRWAELSAGEVVSFRTFMTGELLDSLARHTVLRQTLGEGWDEAAFAEAVSDAMARPEALAGRLFGLHAGTLLAGLDPDAAAARLSGLLIGAELAAARPYWLGRELVIIGAPHLAARYLTALTAQGLEPATAAADEMTLAGLAAARAAA